MGIASKLRAGHFGGRTSTPSSSSSSTRQPARSPGTRAERAAGDTSGIADNKRELAFAAVLALVGIAALYPALYFGVWSQPPEIKAARSHALNMKNWVNFTLLENHRVAHNTRILRFELDPKESLGLQPVSHLLLRAEVVNNRGRLEKITRSYVPISDFRVKGYFDLLIKILPEGMMSQRIVRLNPGDGLEMRGPVGELLYKANMKKHLDCW